MKKELKELMRFCYVFGVLDQKEDNGSWCKQGSTERIEDLISNGILENSGYTCIESETEQKLKDAVELLRRWCTCEHPFEETEDFLATIEDDVAKLEKELSECERIIDDPL